MSSHISISRKQIIISLMIIVWSCIFPFTNLTKIQNPLPDLRTRCTLFMVLYLGLCASAGYTGCIGRTLVHLCASSLQNLTVPHDFHSSVSTSVERSRWQHIRWCGTGGFQEQGHYGAKWDGQCLFIGLAAWSFFVSFCFPFLFFHSLVWYCGAGVPESCTVIF